jgi:uncharacterized protein (DUF2147 family)
MAKSCRRDVIAMIDLLIRPAAVAFLAALAATSPAKTATQPSAVGLWEKLGPSGMPEGWFRIIDCGGTFVGRIVKMFPKRGENLSDFRCTQCRGDQKNAPVLGIAFIKGMRRNGLTYQDGTILDPRDGSIYNALMELSPDGKQLTVRGYLGIPLLGQSEVWHRLPDNALEPNRFASCTSSSASSSG